MNQQENPSIFFSIIVFVFGILILVISQFTTWRQVGSDFGWTLVAIGLPLILWGVFKNLSRLNAISTIMLMRKEKLQLIVKDKERSKKLIAESIFEWARSEVGDTIKIKGVTLNLIFSNKGILRELIYDKKLININSKKIQVLLLNPYSINAMTRSIQESRPFKREERPDPVKDICEHTLAFHKKCVLYEDFESSAKNISDLMNNPEKHKIPIECKIYSTASPSFLLIDNNRAISENLILAKKKNDPEGKLYGMLPHLIYENGEIKDGLENHFDYIWSYDSLPLEDFHEEVEEKYYEINRLFLLYSLQKEIWERQWDQKFHGGSPKGRSADSPYDLLYKGYKDLYPDFSPRRILDLGCGDGGGGSFDILKEYQNAKINFIDISQNAIEIFKKDIEDLKAKDREFDDRNATFESCDMLTFLNRCEPLQYSLVHANFSIIYMTKIKAIEIYRKIFSTLRNGGIFMLSVWTTNYFNMPIGEHGKEGFRPPHVFIRVPMTEDLQILSEGSKLRQGEIRRFYHDFDELLEEFQSADEHKVMDFENIHYQYYENNAVLRVWVKKK